MTKLMGASTISFYIANYCVILVVAAAMIVYDLRTRGRVHPLVAAAVLFGVANNWLASFAHELPAWRVIASRLLGH